MTDMAAAYGMAGWPFWAVIGALFIVVMGRSHLFYWMGRGLFSGAGRLADRAHTPGVDDAAERGRMVLVRQHARRLMGTPTARRGLDLVHRWGPLAVTFAYLTVGVQTAVFVGSGLVRMPYPRFVLASLPGSTAWALVWGTVGLGAVWAVVGLAVASPWALAGLAVLVAMIVVVVRRRHHARRCPARTPAAAGTGSEPL